MRIIWTDTCGSTNNLAARYAMEGELTLVATRCQTAGRGQKGNHWESEPDKNLTFSAVWIPEDFAARNQFALSEAVALSVVDLLRSYDIEAKVKWPNDIYVGDSKICGILLEHSVTGMNLDRTIAGVGINVNQKKFISDAPNPVSMIQLTGTEYPLDNLLKHYASFLGSRLSNVATTEDRSLLHCEFKDNMWRFDGFAYPFFDKADKKSYHGKINDVEEMGFLKIEDVETGELHKYAFKEVEFLLS